jgi:hypothetical protein
MSANDPERTSGDLRRPPLRFDRGKMIAGAINVAILGQKKEFRTSHRIDVCSPCDTFKLDVNRLDLQSVGPDSKAS